MRKHYQQQLDELNNQLIEMGLLIEEAIKNALVTLEKNDETALTKTKELEKQINHMEKELESFCLKLIIQQQPVARDLRLISAALKMITDMERIGDQAEDIAMLSIHLKGGRHSEIMENIGIMGEETTKMLKASIQAYTEEDVKLARKVCEWDDVVDDLFNKVKAQIIQLIRKEDEDAEEGPDLLMIAKYLERIGDHTVNLSEWVIYAVTGKHKA